MEIRFLFPGLERRNSKFCSGVSSVGAIHKSFTCVLYILAFVISVLLQMAVEGEEQKGAAGTLRPDEFS